MTKIIISIFIILPYFTIPVYIFFKNGINLKNFLNQHYQLLVAMFILVGFHMSKLTSTPNYMLFLMLVLTIIITIFYYLKFYQKNGFSLYILMTCIFIIGNELFFLSDILTKDYIILSLVLDSEVIYWTLFSIGSLSMLGLTIQGIFSLAVLVYKLMIIKNK